MRSGLEVFTLPNSSFLLYISFIGPISCILALSNGKGVGIEFSCYLRYIGMVRMQLKADEELLFRLMVLSLISPG